jgi:hypothetical protein
MWSSLAHSVLPSRGMTLKDAFCVLFEESLEQTLRVRVSVGGI